MTQPKEMPIYLARICDAVDPLIGPAVYTALITIFGWAAFTLGKP